MDIQKQAMIHAGVEVVVISGVVFWFQRKTTLLQTEIDGLRQTLSQYEDVLKKQGDIIAQHDHLLRQILGGGQPPINNPGIPQQPSQPPQRVPKRSPPPKTSQTPPPSAPQSSPNPQYVEEQIDEGELDSLLEQELNRVSAQGNSDPEYIEVECIDEVCEIPDDKKKERKSVN